MTYPLHDPIIDAILLAEGWPAYTNDPADRGGPTKGGITLATLGLKATAADLQALSEEAARAIYADRFVTAPGFDGIEDDLLRWQVVDCGVLSGPSRATRWLQDIAGCKVDGDLGPTTLETVNGGDPHRLGVLLAGVRLRFFAAIVEADHTQAKYINGWTARAVGFLIREANRARP